MEVNMIGYTEATFNDNARAAVFRSSSKTGMDNRRSVSPLFGFLWL
jgi:hypothetical protein